MKRLLLFTAVAAFAFTTAQSQEIRMGIKAGVNFASISGDLTDDMDGLTSFHIGGLVEIPISEKFAVQPELLYSAQGAKLEYTETDDFMGSPVTITETAKLKLSYINIPIMAKYYIIDGLAVEAGPQVGFLMSAKVDTEVDIKGDLPQDIIDMINEYSEVGEHDVKDDYNTLDLSLGLGASYRLDMGVFFGLRYTLGLSNIVKDADDFKWNNNVFQVSAGYSF